MKKRTAISFIGIALAFLALGLCLGYSFGVAYKENSDVAKTQDEKNRSKFVGLWRSQNPKSDGSYDKFWLEDDGTYIEGAERKVKRNYSSSWIGSEKELLYYMYTDWSYEVNEQTISVVAHMYYAFENEGTKDAINAHMEKNYGYSVFGENEDDYEKVDGATEEIKGKTYTAIYRRVMKDERYTILNNGTSLMAKDGNLFSKMQTE